MSYATNNSGRLDQFTEKLTATTASRVLGEVCRRATPGLCEKTSLSVTDKVNTGTWINYTAGAATGVAVRRCRITVTAGPDKGLARELGIKRIRIGAREGADIVLSDPEISGLHCEIVFTENGFRLRDLDSTNGTFVGGMRAFEIGIGPNTTIEVGSSSILFEPLSDSIEMPLWQDGRFGEMVGGNAPNARAIRSTLAHRGDRRDRCHYRRDRDRQRYRCRIDSLGLTARERSVCRSRLRHHRSEPHREPRSLVTRRVHSPAQP